MSQFSSLNFSENMCRRILVFTVGLALVVLSLGLQCARHALWLCCDEANVLYVLPDYSMNS